MSKSEKTNVNNSPNALGIKYYLSGAIIMKNHINKVGKVFLIWFLIRVYMVSDTCR